MAGITEKAQAVLSLVAGTGTLAIGSHIVSLGHEMFNSRNSELAAANATWLDSTTVAIDALAIFSGINLASAASKYSAETSEYMPSWLQIGLGISQACTIATPLMLSKIGETISVALETGDIVKACQAVLMGAVIITAGVSNGVAAVKNFSRPKSESSSPASSTDDKNADPSKTSNAEEKKLLPPSTEIAPYSPVEPTEEPMLPHKASAREIFDNLSYQDKAAILEYAAKPDPDSVFELRRDTILRAIHTMNEWFPKKD